MAKTESDMTKSDFLSHIDSYLSSFAGLFFLSGMSGMPGIAAPGGKHTNKLFAG